MKRQQRRFKISLYHVWIMILALFMLAGARAGYLIMTQGLSLTNLTDLVPWGLWIAIDLSAIALGAGAFMLSAAVYLLGFKQYRSVARTAVFIGLICYTVAMMMLLMDIGRPDRFWHGFVFWNPHSPLWEVTMCVGLYFTVLSLEVLPIFGETGFVKSRLPWLSSRLVSIHHLAPILAIAGLLLSMLHQSSLGATYGVLLARPIWYRPGLAVLFIVSAMAAGPSLTLLISKISARLTPSLATVNEEHLDQIAKFIGFVLIGLLYLRFWDALSMSYTYEPARTEGLRMLTKGQLSFNFWVGEIFLGIIIPMIILLSSRLRQKQGLQIVAFLMIISGLVFYRWDTNLVGQLVVFSNLPQGTTPVYTQYTPAHIEMTVGAGVIAYALMAFTIGVRYLKIVDYKQVEETESVPQVAVAVTGD